jgi:hypothetical protein
MAELEVGPQTTVGRKHWSDDMPLWMNRHAHYTGLWIASMLLLSLAYGWMKGESFLSSLDRFTAPAAVGAASYAIYFLVYQFRRLRTAKKSVADGV